MVCELAEFDGEATVTATGTIVVGFVNDGLGSGYSCGETIFGCSVGVMRLPSSQKLGKRLGVNSESV